MSDIFISYAREDRDKAKALAQLLQQQGWSVWWDRNIPPGRSFDQVIEEALGAAKCVVVLWSKNSASSDWVKGEAAEALQRKILVPARIESVNAPLEFRRLQTVDLSGWKGDAEDAELGGLLDAVAANIQSAVQRPITERRQRKLMKPVLTALAIVALLAAGFAFYKFAGGVAKLGSRESPSPIPENLGPEDAERVWRIYADLGNPNAMVNLGLIVKDRSPEEAQLWFKKAADVGNVDAMFDLGMLLKERNPPEAERWLRKAAEAGDLSGMAQLAYLLMTRDPTEAEKWLRKAAAGGVEYAMTDLGLFLMDRKAEEAEVWLRRAAQSNDPRGMYNYGLLVEKRDPQAAKSWFEKAAKAGNSEARLRMLDLEASGKKP
jgi:TPR repeat protein